MRPNRRTDFVHRLHADQPTSGSDTFRQSGWQTELLTRLQFNLTTEFSREVLSKVVDEMN